ncbi:SNAP25 homologous protein SNAP33-like [Primulina eburnea]|uniref:SNAP25 homologous protein SNAP33-like n=1 Tax=Primulina eburnea TaxID=1245227 RepID=UPI003C6C9322
MFGHKKSPLHRFSKHHSGDPKVSDKPISNPFDSDDEIDNKKSLQAARRTSSDPSPMTPNSSSNPFDDDEIKGTTSSNSFLSSAARNKYKNDFRESGGLENQSVQELENYAVYKAEETTNAVNGCLKIAEDMRDDATKTLITLHQQGEQITRTHMVAADIDHDLSRGEKLMGSLGGMFSKTWKPKKTRPIAGPVIIRDDLVQRKGNHLEQREKLGLTHASKERSHSHTPPNEPTNAMQKVEFEKAKQDDSLSDLSNILGELKDMAIDMGSEIERQTKAIDNVQDDVEVLNIRVKGVTQRGRRLLGK